MLTRLLAKPKPPESPVKTALIRTLGGLVAFLLGCHLTSMRQIGIYTTTFTAGSLKPRESRVIAALLLDGVSDAQWKDSIERQNVLQARVPASAMVVARLLRNRLECFDAPLWAMVRDGDKELLLQSLLAEKATSSAVRQKLQTEVDKAKKQLVERLAYDEQLRSYANQLIALDLDDGVKVNCAKFGPLVADAKKVCGTKDD